MIELESLPIGKTRDGREINMPPFGQELDLSIWFLDLTLDDQVDVLCICNYLSWLYENANFSDWIRKPMETVDYICKSLIKKEHFRAKLESLGLLELSARIQLGGELSS